MSKRRQNILLITSDQQHYSTLGIRNPKIKTPNLDRLCARGTMFERAYCPNPVCTPSRSSMITGFYPSHHGAWTIGTHLDPATPTVGDKLADAGYQTGLIGKMHFEPLLNTETRISFEAHPTLRNLEFWKNFDRRWYGFDHLEVNRNHADESHVGQHYAIWMEENGLTNWREYFQPLPGDSSPHAPKTEENEPYWVRRERSWALPEKYHYGYWVAERSIEFMKAAQQAEQPFFLWTSLQDPHPPYVLPEPWASMYDPDDMPIGHVVGDEHATNPPHFAKTQETDPDFENWHQPQYAHGCESHLYPDDEKRKDMAIYYGMVSLMDKHIGQILDYLDEAGLTEDTLIVFTTDHGHFLGQHGLVAKGPFHYEDLIKVPFIVSQPSKVPQGVTSSSMQSLVDLTPTFLEAALGIERHRTQGVSQLPVWQGKAPSARDHIICENRHNDDMPHLVTLVEDRYKITVYKGADYGELFDLREDPDELSNKWNDPAYAERKSMMLQKFVQAYMKAEPLKTDRVALA